MNSVRAAVEGHLYLSFHRIRKQDVNSAVSRPLNIFYSLFLESDKLSFFLESKCKDNITNVWEMCSVQSDRLKHIGAAKADNILEKSFKLNIWGQKCQLRCHGIQLKVKRAREFIHVLFYARCNSQIYMPIYLEMFVFSVCNISINS